MKTKIDTKCRQIKISTRYVFLYYGNHTDSKSHWNHTDSKSHTCDFIYDSILIQYR